MPPATAPAAVPDNVEHSNEGDDKSVGSGDKRIPPYERDRFMRKELINLSALQICCTDERWLDRRHSHTVAFIRKGDANVAEVSIAASVSADSGAIGE